jgi:hypothetical protein
VDPSWSPTSGPGPPEESFIAWNRGIGAHAVGDLARAEAEYRAAAEFGHSGARFDLALLLQHELGRPEEAAALYGGGVAAGDPKAIADLGSLLWRRGERAEPERLLREAAPTSPLCQWQLDWLLAKGGRGETQRPAEFSRPVDLGFHIADAFLLEASYTEPVQSLSLSLLEDGSGPQPIQIRFGELLAFRWQQGVHADYHERDDETYEVMNSAWLAEYERWDEMERDASRYRHLRLLFNEHGGAMLEVLAREAHVSRPGRSRLGASRGAESRARCFARALRRLCASRP